MKDILNDITPEPDSKRLKTDAEEENTEQHRSLASFCRQAEDIVISRQSTKPGEATTPPLSVKAGDEVYHVRRVPDLSEARTAPSTGSQTLNVRRDTDMSSGHGRSSPRAFDSDFSAGTLTPASSIQDSSPLSSPEKKLTPPMPPKPTFRITRNREPAPKTKVSAGEKRKRQATLDMGQQKITSCNECQLVYSASNREDKKRHTEHHSKTMVVNKGLHLGPTFSRNVDDGEKCDTSVLPFEGQVVVCTPASKGPVKKQVLNVLELVTKDLGAVEISKKKLEHSINFDPAKHGNNGAGMETWTGGEFRYKSFLYVHDGRCIGYLLAERIFEANRAVISSGQSSSVNIGARETRVIMGVSRIWVAKDHRMQGIASSLMESARQYFKYLKDGKGQRRKLEYSEIAFSQPTESGMRFAQSFFRGHTDGWLVYETYGESDENMP